MTTTCLVSNYNYSAYVAEAVDSALRQSVPFDQIIVVDDGSTDDSVQLLTERYGNHPIVQIICKENEGQLSCFNEGFARATGDIIFFLDADDVLEPNYVEKALGVYDRQRDCDFLACGRRMFGQREGVSLKFPTDRDLGYSVIFTAFQREWIGTPTSCLSIRRRVLSQILPLPFTNYWRIRADDCLVFRTPWPAHESDIWRSHWSATAFTPRTTIAAKQATAPPFIIAAWQSTVSSSISSRTLCYNFPRLGEFLHREFSTIESPTFRELIKYIRISQTAPISLFRQFSCIAAMVLHFLRAPGSTRVNLPIAAHRPASPGLEDLLKGPNVRPQQRVA